MPIQCPGCNKSFEIHGGSVTRMAVCAHCRRLLDLTASSPQVAAQLKNRPRHHLIPLGAQGSLDGVRWRVLGSITFEDGDGLRWHEYMLLSEGKTIAWLLDDEGDYALMVPTTQKPLEELHQARSGAALTLGSTRYRVTETYTAKMVDFEGELPWTAEVNERFRGLDAESGEAVFSAEWSDEALELYTGRWLERSEIKRAFSPAGVASFLMEDDEPEDASERVVRIMPLSAVFAAVFTCLLVYAGSRSGTAVAFVSFQGADLVQGFETPDFEITVPNKVYELRVNANLDNAWAWLDVDLVHADEGAVLDWGQEVSYYHGWEGGESWSEGGRSSSQVLKIREPGRYRIKIVGKAGRGEHFEENFTGFQGQVQLLKEVTLMRYYAFGLGLALFPFVMWLITHEMESDD